MSKLRRWIGRALLAAGLGALALVLVAAGAALWLRHELYSSLAVLDGELALEGLTAEIVVERDALGVPTIRGQNRIDVARATGFVHAQERFFQMDLLRRRAAGELAELAGAVLLDEDRATRVHRFRARAERAFEGLPADSRALLEAYTEGVNAGLEALGSRPPEYWLLRVKPEPWVPADSLLVVYAMYLDLQDETGFQESNLGALSATLPREIVEVLAPIGTSWDVPLIGSPPAAVPIPPPAVYDLHELPSSSNDPSAAVQDEPSLHAGSNSWAVAAEHTARGAALVASDMHLGLRMPNVWYRVSLEWNEGGTTRRVSGVTLPGAPAIVAGSNGDVAWGFTNAEADTSDLIVLDEDPSGQRYRTAEGELAFERHVERIEIAREEAVELEVIETVWGPVVDRDSQGRRRALRWVAHEDGAADMGLLAFERARNLDEAIELGGQAGIPIQNCVIADRYGRVGWTLAGRLLDRRGASARIPLESKDCTKDLRGLLPGDAHPRLVDPASGRVWTANNLVNADPAWITSAGAGQPAFAARARQIRDRLFELDRATALDMLSLQLDDRALLLSRWREKMLELLDEQAVTADPRRAELHRVLERGWTGRASTDSSAYRLVRSYRLHLAATVFDAIAAPCRAAAPGCTVLATQQWEVPLWQLLEEQPPHLLPPGKESWRELMLAVADEVFSDFEALAAEDPSAAAQTWGDRNTLRMRHPLSPVLPEAIAARLDAPPVALPGDHHMPRVQAPGFGASERFVVSPGREEEGLFHMPGGQSGHPLSPYYLAGHEAWVRGEATPFLPGPTEHRLTLVPSR